MVVKNVVEKVMQYVYCDCCNKKCVFCCLWIVCINVGVCMYGMFYSCLIYVLKENNIDLNCKVFVDLVMNYFELFKEVIV